MTEASVDSARGWIVVAAAVASMFVVFGVAYSFGAFFTSMADEFDAGTSATALIFSLTISLSFILGLFTGRWVDRVGPRPVLLAGAASLVSGLLLTTIVPTLWLGYLTYGVGVGFAIACGYVPMVATVGTWFEKQRATALGVAVAGIGLGTLVGSPAAAALITATSWRVTFVVFAIVGGSVLVLAAFVAERGPAARATAAPKPLRELLRLKPFALLYATTAFITFGIFVPFVFIVPYAEQRGIDEVPAALLVGLIGGSSVLGRLVLGALADRVGAQRLYLLSFVGLTMSHLLWLVADDSYPILVIYAVTLGISYGGFIALSPVVAAEFFGIDGLGGLIGTLYTAAAIGSLAGPPLGGWFIDEVGDRAGIIFAFVMSLIATVVLTQLRSVSNDTVDVNI